ncbi:MAG TPA: PTS sugar transporter subunit IIC [Candidatus Stercoripulliclostridium merdipullorum]|uniref:PTS sugar transporter subunit IIC n=1 Tax=Candidatus Stercoripulliclostridium merdipullorum TaxID=2840952 RepID=A0A9D1NCS5_9FIRM|nr:PTS sugar transporter subunit IIC [Candidatus Stercoripulliclostridium merdipullorum]
MLKPDKAKILSTVKFLAKRWFIDAFTGMAQGLFVTLIAGTIIKQLGNLILKAGTPAAEVVGGALVTIGTIASFLMGAGIGAGIAKSIKGSNLVIFTGIVAGMIGAFSLQFIEGNWIVTEGGSFLSVVSPGNPIGSYVVALIASELGSLVSGKTKLDIILVPLTVIVSAMLATYVAWPFIKLIDLLAKGIELATAMQPFLMGIVIAASMGILLTMPTSSAAMWIAIAMSAPGSDAMLLAGGAAVVGCAAHMVGFAVASFRENGWGGLIAQGLGTSMLQIPNIMRNPRIMLPEIAACIVVGPLATTVFKLRCNAAGGGMGTAGLVGVFGTIEASSGVIPDWQMWLGIVLLMFVLPAVISYFVALLLRKVGWIKPDDQKLETK